MGVYLATGHWPGDIYPHQDVGLICPMCNERPAAWGDWMCSRCRAEFEAQLRADTDMGEEMDD